jgi:hypothetical protein
LTRKVLWDGKTLYKNIYNILLFNIIILFLSQLKETFILKELRKETNPMLIRNSIMGKVEEDSERNVPAWVFFPQYVAIPLYG